MNDVTVTYDIRGWLRVAQNKNSTPKLFRQKPLSTKLKLIKIQMGFRNRLNCKCVPMELVITDLLVIP